MTSSMTDQTALKRAIFYLAIVLSLTTLCFSVFLKFYKVPPSQMGQGGHFFAIWYFGSLLIGIPCLKGIEATGFRRLAVIVAYLLGASVFLWFLFGILGKIFGTFEGI